MTFNYRLVRERVNARLAILGRVDEEVIHALYAKAIAEELAKVKVSAEGLKLQAQDVQARHPDKGWVMIDKAEWAKIGESFDAFIRGLA